MPDNKFTRTSHGQLPSSKEIHHIANAESKRAKPASKQTVHYADFSTIIRLFESFGVDTNIFKNMELSTEVVLDVGAALRTEFSNNILGANLTAEQIKLLDDAYDYLSEEDKPQPSDFLFVFGGKTEARPEKAVELYREGLASQIIFTGRGPSYSDETQQTEAEHYASVALKLGVPSSAIIIEDSSITTPDNVRATLNALDADKLVYQSFILVNSPYSQRRCWCLFQKYVTDDVEIYRSNCSTSTSYSRSEWYKNQDGLNAIVGEFVKIRNAIYFNDA